MVDDDEFDHIVKNLQRVLKLNAQYEHHPYVEESSIWNILFRRGGRCKILFV